MKRKKEEKAEKELFRDKEKRSFLPLREKELFETKRKGSRRRKELLMKNRKRKKAEKAKTEQHAFTVEK